MMDRATTEDANGLSSTYTRILDKKRMSFPLDAERVLRLRRYLYVQTGFSIATKRAAIRALTHIGGN